MPRNKKGVRRMADPFYLFNVAVGCSYRWMVSVRVLTPSAVSTLIM